LSMFFFKMLSFFYEWEVSLFLHSWTVFFILD
jgi:hypothetical protein